MHIHTNVAVTYTIATIPQPDTATSCTNSVKCVGVASEG